MKTDVYACVTDKIIADLEKGELTWRKPWNAEHLAGRIERPLRHNGVPYQGINIILLWAAACAREFTAPLWMTYKQAKQLGGHVRKGAKGELVVYADTFTKTERDENGKDIEQQIPFMKGYTVFNVEEIEELPEHFYARAEPVNPDIERIESAERFFTATGADIRHGGDRAYYALQPDYVQMPPFETFRDAESYYATLAHELTHWTRHPSRLDRDFGRKRWGDEGYAREELVAELGSAFLSADLGLTPETREDHAAYIGSWLEVLRSDKRFIFQAARFAQAAVEHLQSYQPKAEAAAA
jgi:antirestriction protein ArdC